MERTREIAILRSIGASNGSIWRIVIYEGMIIGVISWFFGSILAFPVSKMISDAVGLSMFQAPLDFVFPVCGSYSGYYVVSL